MHYCLADHGLVFSTRDRGTRMLAEISEKSAGAPTVAVDFSNVRSVSYSFVDSFIGQLAEDVAASDVELQLVNVPPSAARTIERSLRRRELSSERIFMGAFEAA